MVIMGCYCNSNSSRHLNHFESIVSLRSIRYDSGVVVFPSFKELSMWRGKFTPQASVLLLVTASLRRVARLGVYLFGKVMSFVTTMSCYTRITKNTPTESVRESKGVKEC